MLARLERNLAGLVVDRYSADDDQHADWAYDAHGRVRNTTIEGAGGATVATQSLDYEPFGDVASLTQSIVSTRPSTS